jgi:hypothetical protein
MVFGCKTLKAEEAHFAFYYVLEAERPTSARLVVMVLSQLCMPFNPKNQGLVPGIHRRGPGDAAPQSPALRLHGHHVKLLTAKRTVRVGPSKLEACFMEP